MEEEMTLPIKCLYIYAYPAQMITIQLINNDNEIFLNENCIYEDVLRIISKYLKKYSINNIFIIGETVFADKIGTMVKNAFNYKVKNIERIKSA